MPRDPQGPVHFHYGGRGKEPTCQCKEYEGCGREPWVERSPEKGSWQAIPIFLPRESHGQRSLAGYSAWGHKESNMTEMT